MMTLYRPLISLILLLAFAPLSAQDTRYAPTRDAEATGYPLGRPIEGEAQGMFDQSFSEQNVGFMHLYAVPSVDPKGTYLMEGEELKGAALEILPAKLKQRISKLDATPYAAAAIKGINENLYIIRLDGEREDRLEMVALRGDEVVHLQTLAIRKRNFFGQLKQTDSYLTDVDGDTKLDLITITRKGNGSIKNRYMYVMDRDTREWEETTELDAPWDSIELYEMGQ